MNVMMIDPALFSWPYDKALALALRAAGHAVTIVGPDHREQEVDRPDLYEPFFQRGRLGGLVQRLPRRPMRLATGALHVGGALGLARHVAAVRPDIVHFQWYPIPLADRLALGRIRRRVPVIATAHNTLPGNGDRQSLLQSAGGFALLRAADHVVVHTEAALERVLRQGVARDKVSIVPHGPIGAIGTEPRRRDRLRLAMVGKLRPYKGLDVLVDSLLEIAPEVRERVEILIAGQPFMDTAPLIEKARAAGWDEASLKVVFGYLSDAELADCFSSASACLMPYRAVDASGILTIALANGCPVIGSAIDGLTGILSDGRDALLVPPEDAGALARAITRFADDASLRQALSRGVEVRREAVASWDEAARRTTEIYAREIARRRPATDGHRLRDDRRLFAD